MTEPYVSIANRVRKCVICGGEYKAHAIATVTCGAGCAMQYRTQRHFERKASQAPIPPVMRPTPAVVDVAESAPVAPEAQQPEPPRITSYIPALVAEPSKRDRSFVWVSDVHAPYEDPKAIALSLKVVDYFRPDYFFAGGDWLDCLAISSFAYDVGNPETHLQHELDIWHALAEAFVAVSPKSERIFIEGNHESRFVKYLWRLPAFRGLNGMNLASLMRLAEHGFKPEMVKSIVLADGNLTIYHGVEVGGSFAGTAARRERQKIGTSGLSGHTHRISEYLERTLNTLHLWIEGGCNCLVPQQYIKGLTANWHQGCVYGTFEESGNGFDMHSVVYRLSGKARIDGKEISA